MFLHRFLSLLLIYDRTMEDRSATVVIFLPSLTRLSFRRLTMRLQVEGNKRVRSGVQWTSERSVYRNTREYWNGWNISFPSATCLQEDTLWRKSSAKWPGMSTTSSFCYKLYCTTRRLTNSASDAQYSLKTNEHNTKICSDGKSKADWLCYR